MTKLFDNSTGGTGILLSGPGSPNHNRFRGINIEQFETTLHIQNGEGNEFDGNYVESLPGGTVFRTGASSWNNIIRCKYIYSASTQTVINDANTTVPDNPNIFEYIKMYADMGSNMSVVRQPRTVIRNTSVEGSGIVAAAFKHSANIVAPSSVINLADTATPALDASMGNHFRLTATADRTIAVPTNPVDGQKIIIEHIAQGADRTLALNVGVGGFAGTAHESNYTGTNGLTNIASQNGSDAYCSAALGDKDNIVATTSSADFTSQEYLQGYSVAAVFKETDLGGGGASAGTGFLSLFDI